MRHLLAALASITLLAPLTACNPPAAPPQTRSQLASPSRRPHVTSAPGFDFYLLNLSWSPEFCSTHPTSAECQAHPAFVLHGLWPQNNDGTYPEHCSDVPAPSDPGQFAGLYPTPSLLQHEWSTHGTCSGLSPDAYLTLARKAVQSVTIPPALKTLRSQISEAPSQIMDQFSLANPAIPRSSLAISCGNNYLTAVEVCFDKQLHATACSNIRSCRAQTIRVVPPQPGN